MESIELSLALSLSVRDDQRYSEKCIFFVQCLLRNAANIDKSASVPDKLNREGIVLNCLHTIGLTCKDVGTILSKYGTNLEGCKLTIDVCAAMLGYSENQDTEEFESKLNKNQSTTVTEKDEAALNNLHAIGYYLYDLINYFPTFDKTLIDTARESDEILDSSEQDFHVNEPDPTYISRINWENSDATAQQRIRAHADDPGRWNARTVRNVQLVTLNLPGDARAVAFSRNQTHRFVIFVSRTHRDYERFLNNNVTHYRAIQREIRQRYPEQHIVDYLVEIARDLMTIPEWQP